MDDRQLAEQGEERFSSAILPRYLKRVARVDSLIPALYLKGVSTGDFSEELKAILGEGAPGLSATSVVRLKAVWEQEYGQWTRAVSPALSAPPAAGAEAESAVPGAAVSGLVINEIAAEGGAARLGGTLQRCRIGDGWPCPAS